MEIERENRIVELELNQRMNVGGVWYLNGSKVKLDAADAAVYEARGFGRIIAAEKSTRPISDEKETISAQAMGVVLKDQPPTERPNREPEEVSPKEKSSGRAKQNR